MKKKLLAVVLSALMVVSTLAGCGKTEEVAPAANGGETAAASYEYDITVWCPELAVDLTKKQIDDFNASNTDGIKLNATIEAVSEADSATQMLTDVEAGADLYFFAQDQIARLIQAGALTQLGDAAAAFVAENNDAGSAEAVKAGDAYYAYPLTSDNGFYMFYDKSVIKEEDLGSMEALLAACNAAGRTFCFELINAWYNAAFFFATGCDSTWVTDDNGEFISVNDTFNSDKGLIAAKGLYKIVSDPAWVNASTVAEFESAVPAAVVVSGPWDNLTAGQILGDNLGAAEMPSFEVDGKSYHLNSFCGNKLLGVKPQTDVAKAACLAKLAQYLTGEACQTERFNELEWGPSNVAAASSDAVQANPGLAALAAQAPYARPQGNIHGSWWDIGKAITSGVQETSGTDAELQTVLQNYYDQCNALFNMTSDEKEAWSVIGSINGTNWDTDFAMTRTADTGDATFYSEAMELHAGEELKARQGASWDVNFGGDGARDGANLAVEEDGVYFVKLVVNDDLSAATLELVKTSFYAWSVIGTVGGTNWDADFEMEIQNDSKTFVLADVEMAAGTEFKVRKNHGWDENFGKDGVAGGDNIVVEADGTYTITFDSETGMVTFE